jgi:hypothetical protein
MTNTERDSPNKTEQRKSLTIHFHRRSMFIVGGLICLLVFSVLAASGSIGAAGSADGELTEAVLDDERVERFSAAFPIPNASGVGIQETTVLDAANNTIYVFGAASCTGGEIFEVRVNVTQNSTGAVSTGNTAAYCLGSNFVQSWISIVEPTGSAEFEVGEAHVDAWARTQRDGETTDTVRWNRTVTVSESYPNQRSLESQTPTPRATETATDSEMTETENGDGY